MDMQKENELTETENILVVASNRSGKGEMDEGRQKALHLHICESWECNTSERTTLWAGGTPSSKTLWVRTEQYGGGTERLSMGLSWRAERERADEIIEARILQGLINHCNGTWLIMK